MIAYDMQTIIDVPERAIRCDVNMEIPKTLNTISFILYRGFNITSVLGDGIELKYLEENRGAQFMPYGKTITLKDNSYKDIQISYEGKIEGDVCNYNNKIHEDFFLLTDYGPWYPVFEGHGEGNIRSKIAGVADYELLNGQRELNNSIWNHQGNVLIGVKNNLVEKIAFDQFEFSVIYYDKRETEAAKKYTEVVKDCMQFYIKEIFNDQINNTKLFYVRPKAKINEGWTFIRDNIIVSEGELHMDETYIAWLMGHELAHIWSAGAPFDWEDWLNESFAEFAACLFLEYRFGREEYNRKIDQHIAINREHYAGEAIRPQIGTSRPNSVHTKGVIIFDKLRNIYGIDAMLEIISIFINLKDKTTENLLSAIKEEMDPDISNWLGNAIAEPF